MSWRWKDGPDGDALSQDQILDVLERRRAARVDESSGDYLWGRAIGAHAPMCARQAARRQYVSVCPDSTLYEQEMPCCLKRFSNNGQVSRTPPWDYHGQPHQYLIGFGRSSHSVVIHRVTYNSTPLAENPGPSTFFPLLHEVILCAGTENLCRDFCLFTPDDQFLIVASADSSSNSSGTNGDASNLAEGPPRPRPPGRNPHSLPEPSSLDDVQFHVVQVATGRITERLKFSRDYILLANHTGVAMNGRRLAILSLQNQEIRIYTITPEGKLGLTAIVGSQLRLDDDREFAERTESSTLPPTTVPSPPPLLGIKQRLFSYLYRQAQFDARGPAAAQRIIYSNWDLLESLCISRCQFLDPTHLLIRFVAPDSLALRSRGLSDGGMNCTVFYVLYSLDTTEILAIHRSTSPHLYATFRDLNAHFRIIATMDPARDRGHSWQTAPSNEVHERQNWEWAAQLLAASRPTHGDVYAAKRCLLNLPYAPQTHSDSPYLDSALFRYDERAVSASERQKSAAEYPVRIFSRRSDRVAFRLNSGACPHGSLASNNPYRIR